MSFANQALSAEYLMKHSKELKNDVYPVPEHLDQQIAKLKLESMALQLTSSRLSKNTTCRPGKREPSSFEIQELKYENCPASSQLAGQFFCARFRIRRSPPVRPARPSANVRALSAPSFRRSIVSMRVRVAVYPKYST